MERSKKIICLFDVDGTLVKPMNKIEPNMIETLKKLKEKVYLGVVGGSDFKKIAGQLGEDLVKEADFFFTENGLYSFQNGTFFHKTSLKDELGEEMLKKLLNFCLKYLSEIDIPIKRGTFIEYRNGMLNISPIGRNCSQEERDDFEAYDKIHKIREKFVNACKENFPNLQFSIGGQISFDVFPKGWDKTYCLRFLNDFEEVYFFGDKTMPGGNDYEIFSHERTKGYTVTSPLDTIKLVNELFLDK